MSTDTRKAGKRGHPGPYLAEVVGNYDPTYMGGLDVVLLKDETVPPKIDKSFAISVKYLSPFYGVMSPRFEGNSSSDWQDAQKSYGMWMVPPDVGTKVLVVFVGGDRNQGYWFGCVQDEFQNHMVPGLAASLEAEITQEQFRRYGTSYLPVTEVHKKSQKLGISNPYYIKKAVHPFAERLLAQGLLLDTVRGITSSSARRESPSRVFGISTPGPLDNSPNARKVNMGYESNRPGIASNVGGSTFVMDDGDADGANELVRIRTRTGHQILLHNSHDLIYIANSKGTAWIELTSNGKIDIFAQDSVSIHTEKDFNFRADRDIHLEAVRSLKISAGSFDLNVKDNYNLVVGGDGKLKFKGYDLSADESIKIESNLDYNTTSKRGNVSLTAIKNLNLVADGNSFITSKGDVNINSGGNHLETATRIFMNGPVAGKGEKAAAATTPQPLEVFPGLPNIKSSAGWANGNFYKADPIASIMLRVPTHEPWPDHENIDNISSSDRGTDTTLNSIPNLKDRPNPANRYRTPLNPNQPTNWKEDKEFLAKAKVVAKSLRVPYEDLMTIMYYESATTMNPNIVNAKTGIATGLIQFTPVAATALRVSLEYLSGLTRTEQLDWVQKFYNLPPGGPKLKALRTVDVGDLYMATFNPAHVDKADNFPLYTPGQEGYDDNPSLDPGKKGVITVGSVKSVIRAYKPIVVSILQQVDPDFK